MENNDELLMAVILPVTYVMVDLLKPMPFIPDWLLPTIAAVIGSMLGILWGLANGADNAGLMVYGAIGFGFGSGATGVNQLKRQAEKKRKESA